MFLLSFVLLVLTILGACTPYIPVYPPTYTPPPPPSYTPTIGPTFTPIFTPTSTPTFTPTPASTLAKWTIMVYIDGDNNLEPEAIGDLNEMEVVGSTSNVNIVAQVDRITGHDATNGDWTGTRRYYVTKDYDPYTINSTLIQDLGEVNMGSPQTLINFASWAINNYPAEHYALIIWNHGGGFRKKSSYLLSRDIAVDDTSNDSITMSELSYALSSIKNYLGKNIDLLGMDACLMSMIEVAYEIKDYANVMVSSEQNEPFDGWPYNRFLARLVANPNMNAKTLGTNIVNDYIAYYQGTETVVLSAVDLTKIESLANAASNFALAVMNDTLSSASSYINDAYDAEYYGVDDSSFVDLYSFMNLVVNDPYVYSSQVKTWANNVMTGVTDAVIQKGSTYIGDHHGLSVYFPYNEYIDSRYLLTKFAQNTYWDEMLRALGF